MQFQLGEYIITYCRVSRKRGIKHLKVVYSKEPPLRPLKDSNENTLRRSVPGSVAFVPTVAGMILAGEVIRDLIKKEGPNEQ